MKRIADLIPNFFMKKIIALLIITLLGTAAIPATSFAKEKPKSVKGYSRYTQKKKMKMAKRYGSKKYGYSRRVKRHKIPTYALLQETPGQHAFSAYPG
jgi:bisphosphoglycerate-dependent phosphoglycerate mutase